MFATADNVKNDMLKQPGNEGSAIDYWTQQVGNHVWFRNQQSSINAAFGTNDSDGNRHENILWGPNGVVLRILAYWKDGITR